MVDNFGLNGASGTNGDLLPYLALLRNDLLNPDGDLMHDRVVESDEEVAIKKRLREEDKK